MADALCRLAIMVPAACFRAGMWTVSEACSSVRDSVPRAGLPFADPKACGAVGSFVTEAGTNGCSRGVQDQVFDDFWLP